MRPIMRAKRAQNRLQRATSASQEINELQPNDDSPKTVKILYQGQYIDIVKPELDIDGQVIPEY